MAVGLVSLDGLWCGQGMANLLRLYADPYANPSTTAPDMVGLFDAGTSGSAIDVGTNDVSPPVDTLLQTLDLQIKAGKPPKFDLVLISHQDTDHWKLLEEFLKQIVAKSIALQVGTVLLGGTQWGTGAKNTIKKLCEYIPGDDKSPRNYIQNETSYGSPTSGATDTYSFDDVRVRTIVANTPGPLTKNTTSAVVVIQLGNWGFVLPGDATYVTLAMCNDILGKWSATPLPPVYMMSAPHHGALSSMTKTNLGEDSELVELSKFIDLTRPYSVLASAGQFNSHNHPYFIILETMIKYAGSNEFPEPHDVVAYVKSDYPARGLPAGWILIPETERNVYTTVCNLVDPLETADWIFGVNSLGHFSTTARFFEAGVRALVGVPQTNPETVMLDMDESTETGGGSGFAQRRGPAVLARDILPGVEQGYSVASADLLGGGVSSVFAPGPTAPRRAWPANRRVRVERADAAS